MLHQVGQEQLAVLTLSQLQELINTSINSAVSTALAPYLQKLGQPVQDKEVRYKTRKELTELFHTTLPTIDKYSKAGLLKPIYFGRRVLYREDELQLSLPKVKTLLESSKKRRTAA
jgi:hypothetical protein